jgi:hypothetical protein
LPISLALTVVAIVGFETTARADHDYTVQTGDDCISIAVKQLGSRDKVPDLHKANPQLGRSPHKLKLGQIIHIPDGTVSPDAKLSNARGDVKVRQPAITTWNNGLRGMDLFRAWRVNTQTKATAEITFVNRSQIEMREDTIVIIYGADAAKTRVDSVDVELERGALRSRLGELAGGKAGKSANVLTPSSGITGVATEFLVSVDKAGASVIANHGASAINVRSVDAKKKPKGKVVPVPKDMGTKVEVGKIPETPRPLPAIPTWTSSSGLALATPTATLRGTWATVVGAAKYRVEVSDASGQRDTVVIEVPATAQAFELKNLPPGNFVVRVAAIDAIGLEGKSSTALAITVKTATADWHSDDNRRELWIGSTIIAPTDKGCSLDQGTATPTVTVATKGKHTLLCDGDSIDFETPAVEARMGSKDAVPFKQSQAIQLAVQGKFAAPLSVRSDDPANATISNIEVSGQSISANVVANKSTQLTITAAGVAIATVQLVVAEPPVIVPPVVAKAKPPRYELGIGVSGQSMLSGTDSFRLPIGRDTRNPTAVSGTALRGVFAAKLPVHLGIELDVSLANLTSRPASSETAQVVAAAANLSLRGHLNSAFELRIAAGGGVRRLIGASSTDGFFDVNLAAVAHLSDTAGVRLDLRDMLIKDQNSGRANRGEVALSLFAKFGK